ncbi:GNAT family N-acetyltransferase, partial [Hungatella sp.]
MMKLRLRPCKREDGREVMKWFSDERQMRMWCRDGFTFPLTDGQMDNYYAELERDPRAWGFTALDKDGKPVGSFKMAAADYEADSVHMGYIVLAPEVRGRGVGQQMVSMAVTYAVELLGMKRV